MSNKKKVIIKIKKHDRNIKVAVPLKQKKIFIFAIFLKSLLFC
jgi:hypothetical protein